jgi:hypothetical protein
LERSDRSWFGRGCGRMTISMKLRKTKELTVAYETS